MTNKRIGVTLTADESGLRRGLNLASMHAGQFAKETEAAMDRASAATERTRTMIGNMARSAAGILAVGKVIGLADEFGQLQSRLEGATRSHTEYLAVQERLVDAAGRTYRSVADGVEVYARTAGSLRELGYQSQSAADLVATMQYGLTIAAADAEKTGSAVDAVSKSILNGKMGMDQYLAVLNASPRLAQALADSLGVTNGQLMQMVQNGGLSVQQLMTVTSQMENLGAEADKMKTSVADAMTRGWDRLGMRINELNEATGATDMLVSAIDLATENLGLLGAAGGTLAAGYLVKTLGTMSQGGWEAAKAFRAQWVEASATRPAVQALAAANLAVAEAEQVKARSASQAATASFAAARGSAQEAAAAQTVIAARAAEAAADRNAAAAKAAVAAASGGVSAAARLALGVLGGPAGLIGIAAATAAGFLLFSDNADEATRSLLEMGGAVDEQVKTFQELDAAQRRPLLRAAEQQLEDFRDAAAQAFRDIEGSVPSLARLRNPEAFAEFQRGLQDVRSGVRDLDGVVQQFIRGSGAAPHIVAGLERTAGAAARAQQSVATSADRVKQFQEVVEAANGATRGLAQSAQQLATGMAAADWDKHVKGLTESRDVIGMTAKELAEYQARARGANDAQAQLAGIIGSQTDAYKTLEKAIQDKDAKAQAGAVKVLDDLAKQEAATAALTTRTAALAKLQLEIARGVSLAYAESAMANIDAQAQAAYDAKLAEHRERLQRILANTSPSATGGKTAETEGQKLLKGIEDRIEALKVEAAAYGSVTEAQKELIEFERRLARDKDGSLRAVQASVRARLAEKDALEKTQLAAERTREMQKAYSDSILDANASLYESYLRLSDQTATWDVNEQRAARNLEMLEQARLRDRIATEEQTLWRQLANEESAKEIEYTAGVIDGLTRQLELRQKLAWLGDVAQSQAETRRRVQTEAQEWMRAADGLRETFQEGFFAALGDQDAVSAFGDNLKRTAKTALATAAYEAFAKPLVVRLIAQVAGLAGGSQLQQSILQHSGMTGSGSTSLGSSVSGMLYGSGALPGSLSYANWASATPGSAAYAAGGDGLSQLIAANPQWTTGGLTGWFTNVPASSIFSFGGYNSATGMSSAAGGLATAGAGLIGGYLGGSMFGNKGQSAMGGGLGASAGMMIGTSSAVAGTTLGAQLGTAAGPIGAAIGMVLGSALGSLIGSGETRYGGGYTVGADGQYFRSGGPSGGDPNESQTIQTITGVRDSVRDLAARLGGDASNLHFGGGYELSPDKGRSFVWSDWVAGADELSWQRGMRDLSGVKDAETVAAEFGLEMQRAVLRGLQMSGLDTAFADYLGQFDISALDETGVAAVTANLDAMAQFRDALTRLPFEDLAGIALEAGLKLAQFSGGIEPLLANMQTYYDLVYSEEEKVAHLQAQVAEGFEGLGLAMPGSVAELRSLVEGLDTTTDAGLRARAGVYALAGAFGQLQEGMASLEQQAEAAAEAAIRAAQEQAAAIERAQQEAFGAQYDLVQRLATEAGRLATIRSTAGSVLDRIAAAQAAGAAGDPSGAAGRYASAREAEMWVRLTTGSYEQQIELASELTDIELDRYNAEIEAAERMRDLGRSLGSYLDSLSVGDLSPLTLGQRTAEAEWQLMDTIARAQVGDLDAMGRVQGQLETALRLWREYGASGSDYQSAYDRLTGAAGDLAAWAQADADRQLAVAEGSLEQLAQLQVIAERAYNAIDAQYHSALQASQHELAMLTAMASDTDRLHDVAALLQGMPAGIAAALQPVLSGAMGNIVSGWYADAGYGQGDQAGRDYWQGQLGQRPQDQVKADFDASIVTTWYRQYLGHDPDPAGLAHWIEDIKRWGADGAKRAFLASAGIDGSHRDGLWLVPRDGYRAELHAGEAVLPQPEAQRYRALAAMPDWTQSGRGQGNVELIAEIRRLNDRIALLEGAVVKAVDNNTEATARGAAHVANTVEDSASRALHRQAIEA
ncbi:tape measure protein [Verticiella sediminum]|nr:tape measure protein [Verticiella sediminum]